MTESGATSIVVRNAPKLRDRKTAIDGMNQSDRWCCRARSARSGLRSLDVTGPPLYSPPGL